MKRYIKANFDRLKSEEEQLDDAILNGKPFRLDTFTKYKVDPYRAKGAVKAEELKVGDIIQVTEDAAEIDCPSPEIEIINIDYSDPDGYGGDCITFYCLDNETGDEYTLHFWPEEWVGPIISRKSDYTAASTKITSDIDIDEYEDDGPRPGYILWNISWWDQRGNQCGENLELPKDEEYPGIAIEHYLSDKYGDEYGGIADYMGFDDEDNYISSATTINRYSDARPYEERKYWYFTTHGIGPGTIPEDLNVLEVREGQNDKGTWGDYICLDGVLNTSELEKYDLRELAPSDNITSAEEIDEFQEIDDMNDALDEWDPYHGLNYRVDGNSSQKIQFYINPTDAIRCWFKYQKDAPGDVNLMARTKNDAIRLVEAATPHLLTKLYSQYKCPYKLDWLIDEAEKKVEDGCKYFYENEYGYGDSVHPFGVG